MALFPPEFLDDLRARVGLAEVIARAVPLQKHGREWRALCPFHNEKTPSFYVNEDKGFYHCFGCGAHGDAIGFLMQKHGLSFVEAVERLAAEAGLPVPRTTPEDRARAERAAGLREVVEAACRWFESRLHGAAGRAARAYLAGRGLDDGTIRRFRLGFAPADRRALSDHLKAELHGVDDAALAEAGLLIRPEEAGRAPYDRFRNRIMFPIADPRGRIVAFGGRLLDGDGPKYLNSPETPLFHKGRTLYGLAQAREAAHDSGEVIVCEGYMDVIALAQAGLPQTVAPLGTALTEAQMEALWRLAPEPILCFDGDSAGLRAAARAAERALPLLQPGRTLRFAWLPENADPDDLVRGRGPEAVRAVLDDAEALSAVLWRLEASAAPVNTAERRAALRQRLNRHVRRIADRTVANEFQREFDLRFEGAFAGPPTRRRARTWPEAGGRARSGVPGRGAPRPAPVLDDGTGVRARVDSAGLQHRALLAALINHPELIDEYGESVAQLRGADAGHAALGGAIVEHWRQGLDTEGLKRQFHRADLARALSDVLSDEVYRHAGFARPDASLEDARMGCQDIFSLIGRRAISSEVRDRGRARALGSKAE